ncbi:MAG: hypothetical protein NTX88_08440 [Candidatus Atribacteria bacterium]|nr:hypothetical protein [Candidatus Atribacteria bacterium]
MNAGGSGRRRDESGIRLSAKAGRYAFAICFPGPYTLGMANLGYQSVMNSVYCTPDWRVERFFADTGLSSLEHALSLSSFHWVGFSL